MKTIKVMEGVYNYDMCKSCGGACCQRMAGSYIPSDFKQPISVSFITKLLDSGLFAVDWFEGDVLGQDKDVSFYLRPRHVNAPTIDPSFGATCIHWSQEKGCALSEKNRPYQCRMLIPNLEEGCDFGEGVKATKKDCAIAWYEYNDTIERAMNRHRKHQINKLT